MASPRTRGTTVRIDDDVFVRRDGSDLNVEYTSAPFETAEGVSGAVVIFRDISARKARENEMERRIEALSWIGRIRDALRDDRFAVHAQPIVDLSSGQVVRYELLIRMLADDGTIVLPGSFLPVAEEYSLIGDIDRWMVDEAARLAARGSSVSVNLSAQSIAREDSARWFADAVEAYGCDPGRIVVELTETALLENEARAAEFIRSLSGLGCKLALDDFGTGYGGFTYLKRFQVDFLKVDTEFVRDLVKSRASEHVVRAVVNLAEGFGLEVVAEGVEDAETLSLLREIGVGYAQGIHIAQPAPYDEALAATGAERG